MMEWISPLMMSDWKGNHQYDSFPPSINLIEKDRKHLASQTLGIQIVKVPGCRLTKDVSLQGLIPTTILSHGEHLGVRVNNGYQPGKF